MKFTLTRTSSESMKEDREIELTTLEDLIALCEQEGHAIIVSKDPGEEWELEVYDDYRE